jgi:hypothetical protein
MEGKGEGNDNVPGDKGSLNGDPYANSYYGTGSATGSGLGLEWKKHQLTRKRRNVMNLVLLVYKLQ